MFKNYEFVYIGIMLCVCRTHRFCQMAGVILENVSTKKLVLITLFLFGLSLSCFILGGLKGTIHSVLYHLFETRHASVTVLIFFIPAKYF